ncbi:MAG: transporter substrate-binding domain-containing protein, partial [Gammaproteobacteria bacterium]
SLHRLRMEPVTVSTWDGLIPALLQGRGDLVAGRFTVTEARSRQVAFTTEVFPTRNVVLTRRPGRVVTTLDELRAEKVGKIKEQIEAGAYHVDAEEVAKSVARSEVARLLGKQGKE